VSNKSRSPKTSHLPSVSEDKDGVGIEEAAQEELKNEAFVVEIFLDDDHQVTSTQVLHVKRNEGETWAGWDERRLIGFLVRHAGIAHDEPVSKITAEATHATKAREPEVEVAVKGLAVLPQGAHEPATLLNSGESFDVKMAVSVRGRVPGQGLSYTAGAYARRAKNRTKIELGETIGRLRANQDAIVIAAPHKDLQAGSYTVSAYLLLSPLEKGNQSHRLGPFLTSGALEVR
jgi:hypothetical protein